MQCAAPTLVLLLTVAYSSHHAPLRSCMTTSRPAGWVDGMSAHGLWMGRGMWMPCGWDVLMGSQPGQGCG